MCYVAVFINHDAYISCFVGNSLWLVAVGYYVYVTFLGYSCQRKPILVAINVQFTYDLHYLLSSCGLLDTAVNVFAARAVCCMYNFQ